MRKKKKAELAALDEWTHINCLQPEAQEVVQDDVLRRLLYRPPVIETKKAIRRATSLLEAADLSNIEAMEALVLEKSVQDLPAGVASFLFERTSDEPPPEEIERDTDETA